MGKRTNTAKWMENQKRWQVNVQKDGVRRSFTSSKPGRTGQREANAKADAWLDDGIDPSKNRVDDLLDEYLKIIETTTSFSNYKKESYFNVFRRFDNPSRCPLKRNFHIAAKRLDGLIYT